jgi:serine/threonine protein kinase
VVLKELNNEEVFHSSDSKFWATGKYRETPREVEILRRLTKRRSRYILPLRGYSVNQEHSLVCIYMDFAKYGDVYNTLEARESYLVPYGLPEPYIWYAAFCLVSALRTLETGVVDGEEPDSWDSIIHLDLKPKNVVVVEPSHNQPDREKWTKFKWPDIQLIDFGTARELSPEKNFNPLDFIGSGTERYKAPETKDPQPPGLLDEYETPIDVTCKADVFQIGHILYSLMIADNIRTQPELLGRAHPGRLWAYAGRNPDAGDYLHEEEEEDTTDVLLSADYSHDLQDFVRRCLEFQPDRRLSAKDLEKYVKGKLDKWETKRFQWKQKDDAVDPFQLGVSGRPKGRHDVGRVLEAKAGKQPSATKLSDTEDEREIGEDGDVPLEH